MKGIGNCLIAVPTRLRTQIQVDGQPDGQRSGIVEADIPRSEVDFYASPLLSVGIDVRVESLPELVEALRNKVLQRSS